MAADTNAYLTGYRMAREGASRASVAIAYGLSGAEGWDAFYSDLGRPKALETAAEAQAAIERLVEVDL